MVVPDTGQCLGLETPDGLETHALARSVQVGLEADDLGVPLRHQVGVEPLVGRVGLDVDVRAVGERRDATLVFGLVAHREELEGDLQSGPGVLAVRVEVDRRRADHRARPQEPASIVIENVRVPADLVNGPGRATARRRRLPNHVVDDVPLAHRLPAVVLLVFDVINFADLHGPDITILLQSGRKALDLTPPVGVPTSHEHFFGDRDEVGPDGPLCIVIKHPDGGQIRWITFGRAVVRPSGDHRDLLIAEGGVLLVLLDADVFLDVPGRHGAGTVTDRRALFDPPGKPPRFVVRDERHGGHTHRVVAILAAALQDRRDVLVERHVFRIKSDIGGGGEVLRPECKWHHQKEGGREHQNPTDRDLPLVFRAVTHRFHSDCG